MEDDGVGISQGKLDQLMASDVMNAGVAIKNISRRMISRYNQNIEITSEIECGTQVVLRIPLEGRD